MKINIKEFSRCVRQKSLGDFECDSEEGNKRPYDRVGRPLENGI